MAPSRVDIDKMGCTTSDSFQLYLKEELGLSEGGERFYKNLIGNFLMQKVVGI